ncbi:hypothetical protein NDU88_003537 [Pleurodeles waltl]|uniref:Uncharacterized protein n=1 Tax=Pleurodeles waltl TaxID=8319 RepID=A0AAV7LFM3_PLEWA|nr:hypothetical protein NDU88_003537 [Pleurodeles waltl]
MVFQVFLLGLDTTHTIDVATSESDFKNTNIKTFKELVAKKLRDVANLQNYGPTSVDPSCTHWDDHPYFLMGCTLTPLWLSISITQTLETFASCLLTSHFKKMLKLLSKLESSPSRAFL